MPRPLKRLPAVFFRAQGGGEPLRDWLKGLPPDDRRAIGFDIQKAEYGWPLGMPLARSLGDGLHEMRTNLPSNRTARIFFYVSKSGQMVLLHGMIKKTAQTPKADLAIARRNKRAHQQEAL